jgi:2-polyprenyl-3-methyl-5-hydroxy-6-metoxy-1,4-benzoquinol methylase
MTPDTTIFLANEERLNLLQRYRARLPSEALFYGTARDFCDSADHLPFLSSLQGDLKDLQRPAALKLIVGLLPPGSSLLEIGAGEPYVAHVLSLLGYNVTVVDPYDGSGRGPTEFDYYRRKYPDVTIVRNLFSKELTGISANSFDCIYSISVLEHVPQPALAHVFAGIRQFLKAGGHSLHLVDHVLAGNDAEFHLSHLGKIVASQSELTLAQAADPAGQLAAVLDKLTLDLDTYYLSAEGHNKWRGGAPYDSFPFRKVVSVHSWKQYVRR